MTIEDAKTRYIDNRHQSAKRSLVTSLEWLQHGIARALRDIESGNEGLDAHLITNAGQITHEIALYNLTRNLREFDEVK